jgi:hypothetical protein
MFVSNKYHMRYQQLLEGGNIFKDQQGVPLTRRITKEEIPQTVAWLERILRIPLRQNLIGSTGKKPDSGDIDIAVDSTLFTKEEIVNKLITWCQKQGVLSDQILNTRMSKGKPGFKEGWIEIGGEIHFRVPIKGDSVNGFAQADFIMSPDLDWAKFVHHSDPSSKFKGVDRNIMINSIAKSMGLKLNMKSGIYRRSDNELVSNDPDAVAKLLLNQSADRSNLDSVEHILLALKSDPNAQAKLADAKEDFSKRGINLP